MRHFLLKIDEDRYVYVVIRSDVLTECLGYTNLESEKGFGFFQRFLDSTQVFLDELEKLWN